MDMVTGQGAGCTAPEPVLSDIAAGMTEPADQDWLESLSIRAQLSNPAFFDGPALLWRRFQPAIYLLRHIYRSMPEEIWRAGLLHGYYKDYLHAIEELIAIPPAEQWVLCGACGGSGMNHKKQVTCCRCLSYGFEIPDLGIETWGNELDGDDDDDE